MAEVSAKVQQARDEVIVALLHAGGLLIANLDSATPESRAEYDRAMEDAKFKGIVLNELLLEEGNA